MYQEELGQPIEDVEAPEVGQELYGDANGGGQSPWLDRANGDQTKYLESRIADSIRAKDIKEVDWFQIFGPDDSRGLNFGGLFVGLVTSAAVNKVLYDGGTVVPEDKNLLVCIDYAHQPHKIIVKLVDPLITFLLNNIDNGHEYINVQHLSDILNRSGKNVSAERLKQICLQDVNPAIIYVTRGRVSLEENNQEPGLIRVIKPSSEQSFHAERNSQLIEYTSKLKELIRRLPNNRHLLSRYEIMLAGIPKKHISDAISAFNRQGSGLKLLNNSAFSSIGYLIHRDSENGRQPEEYSTLLWQLSQLADILSEEGDYQESEDILSYDIYGGKITVNKLLDGRNSPYEIRINGISYYLVRVNHSNKAKVMFLTAGELKLCEGTVKGRMKLKVEENLITKLVYVGLISPEA